MTSGPTPTSGAGRGDKDDDGLSTVGEFVQSAEPATGVLAYLTAGPITFGGIGWALDAWLGTQFLLVLGLLGGMGLAFYVIWLRYGKA